MGLQLLFQNKKYILKVYFILNFVYVCRYVHMCTCDCRDQKKTSDPQDLQFQAAVNLTM